MEILKRHLGWIVAAGFFGLILSGTVVNMKIVRDVNGTERGGSATALKTVSQEVHKRVPTQFSDLPIIDQPRLQQSDVPGERLDPQEMKKVDTRKPAPVSSPILVN